MGTIVPFLYYIDIFFNHKTNSIMRTFFILVEIIDERFNDDEPTERFYSQDEYEVLAIDDIKAIEQLREDICFHNMNNSRDFKTLEIHEVV
jgi:hypothetical protein